MTYHNFIEVLNCKIQGNSSEGICYLSREREVTESTGVIQSTVGTGYWNAARPEELWDGTGLTVQHQTHMWLRPTKGGMTENPYIMIHSIWKPISLRPAS